MNGIVTNLLAAGLIEGPAADRRRIQAFLRRDEFSEEIAARETGEFTDIMESWNAVVNAVVDIDEGNGNDRLVFVGEVDAIERIPHAIASEFATPHSWRTR